MMRDLFYGSCLSIILSFVLTQITKKQDGRMLIIVLFPFIFFVSTYYAAVLLGVFLAYEEKEIVTFLDRIKNSCVFLFLSLALFILFAGYPSAGNTFTGAYAWANWIPTSVRGASHLFHIIGAFILFIIWFMYKEKIDAWIPRKLSVFLSTISFSVYLVHPFINSFISFPVWKYLRTVAGVEVALAGTVLCAVPICIVFSYLFNRVIEKRINIFINKMTESAFPSTHH